MAKKIIIASIVLAFIFAAGFAMHYGINLKNAPSNIAVYIRDIDGILDLHFARNSIQKVAINTLGEPEYE